MTASPFFSRGLAFDTGVLAANLALVPLLADTMREEGPAAGALLIVAWGALALGAHLKRVPLQARLALRRTVDPPAPTAVSIAAFVLLVMLWGLGAALLAAGGELLGAAAGSLPALAAAAFGWLPAALHAAALVAPGSGRTSAWRAGRRSELVADLLLGAGAVISFAWWESAFAPELTAMEPVSWPLGLLAVALVTVPFAMFYLAPRLPLLVEDWRRPRTWISAAVAMSPLAWRIVF